MNKKFKLFVIAFLVFSIFVSVALWAEIKESELYYVNMQILRIYTHSKGYYIIYRKSGLESGEAFIPYSWFKPQDGRAVMGNHDGRITPYLSYYTKNGEFDHIKLVIPKDPKHLIWGTLKNEHKYDDSFDIEALDLDY